MKDMFFLFLVARPVFIVCYTTATAICNMNATYYQTAKIRKEKVLQNKKGKSDKTTSKDNSDNDSSESAGVLGKEKKKKKIDDIAEEIEYEFPDIP